MCMYMCVYVCVDPGTDHRGHHGVGRKVWRHSGTSLSGEQYDHAPDGELSRVVAETVRLAVVSEGFSESHVPACLE